MKSWLRFWAIVGIATLLTAPTAFSWEYSAQLRPRIEGRNGYRTLPVEDVTDGAWFVSQRTRLALGHRVDEKVSLFIQVQDVRTWGEETSTLNDYSADNFDVHQAFVDLTPNELWAIRVGRQELVYDGHRIMGNVGWTQQGRSHDAVRVALARNEWTGHFVLAHNEGDQNSFSTPYPNAGNYRDLAMLWVQREGKTYKASVILLYDSYEMFDPQYYPKRYTFGPRVAGTAGPDNRIIYRAEFYLQTGTLTIVPFDPHMPAPPPYGIDLKAYLLGLRLGYDFGNIVLTGWYDLISGDDDLFDGTYKAFDTPYPTNHKFYGWADYFLNIPNDTDHRGLQDFAIKAKIKRIGPFSGQIHGHYFWLAQATNRPSVASLHTGKSLGWEVDAMLKLPVTDGTDLSFGVSHVAPDDALIRLKRGSGALESARDGNWGWVMLDVNVK